MKINTEINYLYTRQHTQSSAAKSTAPGSFSPVLATDTDETSSAKQADFTSMTRQEMFDWMNNQIRSGKMSLDESFPFLGMTIKISVTSGQPVDMATDTVRVNFIEKARLGIKGALSRNDLDLAKRLRVAIEIMNRQQGQKIGVDTRA